MDQELLNIDSFVIRFIHPSQEGADQSVRGIVTHVQSAKHLQFTCWDDAVGFIKQFVNLADLSGESVLNFRGDSHAIGE